MRLHNPATGTTTQIANFADPSVPLTQRIYTNSEDGMYGPAIDNNFATNKWVYLYYSPQIVNNIKYSDGTTGHTNDFSVAPFLDRRRARSRPRASARGTRGSATSSSRASSSSMTLRAARRTST